MDEFIEELKKLQEKHGLYIADYSCGCCGHTSLEDKDGKTIASVDDDNGLLRKALSGAPDSQ
jgi:hypothetical protein